MTTKATAGLRVLDLATGMASALVGKLLAEQGATLVCLPPAEGDPFFAVYPAYATWKAAARIADPAERNALIAWADVCLTGGEDHPDIVRRSDADALTAANSRLIVLDIGTFGDGRAVDLLVQARMGLVNEQLTTQPVRIAASLPTFGAALTGLLGVMAALIERESSGAGQIVHATYEQGTAMFWSQIWMDATKPDPMFDKLPPKDVRHLIFQCADGGYVHFVLGVPGALAKLYGVLEIPIAVDPGERGVPSLERGPAGYFADPTHIAPAIARWRRADLVQALWAAGIAAEPVHAPGETWDDPQVEAVGIIRTDAQGLRSVGNPIRVMASDTPPSAQGAAPSERSGTGPLAGLRIIDLGNFIAGPFASKLLADLGADVIKVEPPTGLANLTGLRNTWSSNRGKRSIVVDLKRPEGLEIVHALCAGADAAHHNFRLGVANRLGVDPASLQQRRPDIVTLETSGYGSNGPKADKPGWDMVMQALSGMEVRAGGEGNPPLWYRSAIVDYGTGALGAIAMLMGIYHRLRTGAAVQVEVSLMNTALFMLAELIQHVDGRFEGAPLLNSARTGYHPAEQIYRTRDDWIAIAARGARPQNVLARTLGIDASLEPTEWGAAEEENIAARLSVMNTDEALEQLAKADIWAVRCAHDAWPALRGDRQARAVNLVITAPDTRYGEITGCFGPPVSFSRTAPQGPFRSAPAAGADTRAILAELGLAHTAVERLYAEGVVK